MTSSTVIISRLLSTYLWRRIFCDGVRLEDAHEFRHDQIRDVVYGLITGDRRQQLHGILAHWLEGSEASATGAEFAVLAQHFEAAGNGEKAVAYAERAAAKALQVGAYREVEDFLKICFSYEVRHPRVSAEQRLRAVHWRIECRRSSLLPWRHSCSRRSRSSRVDIGRRIDSAIASERRCWLIGSALQLLFQQSFPYDMGSMICQKGVGVEMARCHDHAATVDFFELRYVPRLCVISLRLLFTRNVSANHQNWPWHLRSMASGFGYLRPNARGRILRKKGRTRCDRSVRSCDTFSRL